MGYTEIVIQQAGYGELRDNSWYDFILKNDFGRGNSQNSGFSYRHYLVFQILVIPGIYYLIIVDFRL